MNSLRRTRKKILHLTLALILIGFLPTQSFAWGEKGHRIIAALAWYKLGDQYKREIQNLLGSQGVDPDGPLAAIAGWADRQALQYPEQRKWHFVDIPLSETSYDEKRDCSDGNCLVKKLDEKKVEFQFGKDRQTRIQALSYLVHLIADIHQPLHCTDNDDNAGNRVQVKFEGNVTNLHKVWDSDMIEKRGLTVSQYVENLKNVETSKGFWFADWANDSHAIARRYVYAIPNDKELGGSYYRSNLPILERQLAKAAEKLVQVLEDALGSRPYQRRAR
jgi:nuclease S1